MISIAESDLGVPRAIAAAVLLVRLLRRDVVLSPILRLEAAARLSGTSTKLLYSAVRRKLWKNDLVQGISISSEHREFNGETVGGVGEMPGLTMSCS